MGFIIKVTNYAGYTVYEVFYDYNISENEALSKVINDVSLSRGDTIEIIEVID